MWASVGMLGSWQGALETKGRIVLTLMCDSLSETQFTYQ